MKLIWHIILRVVTTFLSHKLSLACFLFHCVVCLHIKMPNSVFCELQVDFATRTLYLFSFYSFVFLLFRQKVDMSKKLCLESRSIQMQNCAPIQFSFWPRNAPFEKSSCSWVELFFIFWQPRPNSIYCVRLDWNSVCLNHTRPYSSVIDPSAQPCSNVLYPSNICLTVLDQKNVLDRKNVPDRARPQHAISGMSRLKYCARPYVGARA